MPMSIGPSFSEDIHLEYGSKEQFLRMKLFILLLFVFSWVLVLIYAEIASNSILPPTGQSTKFSIYAVRNAFGHRKIRIILFGDSMVQKPIQQERFIQRLNSIFPSEDFNFTNSGKNGQKISELRHRLNNDIIAHHPDGVVLFWDSDVSSSQNSPGHLLDNSYQTQYENDLQYIVNSLRGNVSFVTVAGPIVLGEGPLFQPKRFSGRNEVLDLYTKINERVCASANVSFINFRKLYREATPLFWLINQGFLTKDGEHGNERGIKIIVDNLSIEIANWLNSLS